MSCKCSLFSHFGTYLFDFVFCVCRLRSMMCIVSHRTKQKNGLSTVSLFTNDQFTPRFKSISELDIFFSPSSSHESPPVTSHEIRATRLSNTETIFPLSLSLSLTCSVYCVHLANICTWILLRFWNEKYFYFFYSISEKHYHDCSQCITLNVFVCVTFFSSGT